MVGFFRTLCVTGRSPTVLFRPMRKSRSRAHSYRLANTRNANLALWPNVNTHRVLASDFRSFRRPGCCFVQKRPFARIHNSKFVLPPLTLNPLLCERSHMAAYFLTFSRQHCYCPGLARISCTFLFVVLITSSDKYFETLVRLGNGVFRQRNKQLFFGYFPYAGETEQFE